MKKIVYLVIVVVFILSLVFASYEINKQNKKLVENTDTSSPSEEAQEKVDEVLEQPQNPEEIKEEIVEPKQEEKEQPVKKEEATIKKEEVKENPIEEQPIKETPVKQEPINIGVIEVTNDSFDSQVMQSDKIVLIDFYANWCGPCKMLSPIVEEVANENPNIKVVKINVDNEDELAIKYNVVYIPTLIVIKNENEINRSVGLISKEKVLELIK